MAPQIAGFALGGSAGVAFEPRTTGLRLLRNPLSGHLLLGPREVPPVGVARSPPSPVRGQVVLLGLRPSRPALAPQIAGFVCIRFSFSVRILLFWPRGVRGGVNLLRCLRNKRPALFEAQLETTAQKNLCVLCPNPRPPPPPPHTMLVLSTSWVRWLCEINARFGLAPHQHFPPHFSSTPDGARSANQHCMGGGGGGRPSEKRLTDVSGVYFANTGL